MRTATHEPVRPRWKRAALTAIALAPVVVSLSLVELDLARLEARWILPCHIMADGLVPVVVGTDRRCPLERVDQVVALETADGSIPLVNERAAFVNSIEIGGGEARLVVERHDQQEVVSVPRVYQSVEARWRRAIVLGFVVAAFMGFALRVFWLSRASAATGLLLLHAVLIALILPIFAHLPGPALTLFAGSLWPFIPAALLHLALTFPYEVRWVAKRPSIASLPYVAAAGADAITALSGDLTQPASRVVVVYVSMSLTWAVIAGLCINAARRAWHAGPALERMRARLLLVGSAGPPLAIGAVHFGWGADGPGGALTPLVAGILVTTVPIGFAITRYDLFDLRVSARRGLDAALRLVTVAGVAALGAWGFESMIDLHGPALWFSVGALAFAVHEALQRTLGGGDWLARGTAARRALLEDRLVQLNELAPEDASARILGEILEAGLEDVSLAIFLHHTKGWRRSFPGPPTGAFGAVDARAAERALEARPHLHLARGDVAPGGEVEALAACGVELVVGIRDDRDLLGLILLGSPLGGRPLTSEEVAFVEKVASRAAVGIRNARRLEEQLALGRRAELVKLARRLAHDLIAPLRGIEAASLRIASHPQDAARAQAESDHIRRVTALLLDIVREVLEEAKRAGLVGEAGVSVEEIVTRAIESVVPRAEHDRIWASTDSDLPRLAKGDRLARVVGNLLTNALAASPPEAPVEVRASWEDERVQIVVRDLGVGMSPDELKRVWQPLYRGRRDEGHGMGLCIAREIVQELGGTLSLTSESGRGTEAIIRVPASA